MLTRSQIISRLNDVTIPATSVPRAAVFIPLVEINNEIHLLFQVRAATLTWQPGDICFPGGKVEQTDSSTAETALRETEEELGLSREDLVIYKELPPFFASLGLKIYPVIGEILNPQNMTINTEEVEKVFYVPLSWFINHTPKVATITMGSKPSHDFPFDLVPLREKEWQENPLIKFFFILIRIM